jgi:hypothetical protein
MAKRKPGKTLNEAAVKAKVRRAKKSTAVHDKPRLELAQDAPVENSAAVENAPVHLARCMQCDFEVRFRASASGASFTLIDSDLALGIGKRGHPICPNGHGEMVLADETLPASEAISTVAAVVGSNGSDPTQAQLFDLAKPFNYEGAMQAIATKNHDVKFARVQMDDAKETYTHRRKTWERETEQLQELIDRLEARERDVRRDAAARAAKATHEQAETIAKALHEAGWDGVGADVVETWTEDQRHAARQWLDGEHDRASVPDLLGVPHVAAGQVISETHDYGQTSDTYQCCSDCGARLITLGDGVVGYPMGALIGFNCTGSEKAEARTDSREQAAANA